MNVQKITSLTLLLSFVLLAVTSVVLYVVPEGRVAYWSDWRWLGLSKTQWGAVHINSGFLFLAAGFVHLWCNWRAVVAYLKNKARKLRIVTPAFTAALATSGIKAEPEQSLQEIAGEHNTDPNIVFGLIHEASKRN